MVRQLDIEKRKTHFVSSKSRKKIDLVYMWFEWDMDTRKIDTKGYVWCLVLAISKNQKRITTISQKYKK